MSQVPHSLTRSEPVIYSWNLRWLFCRRKERGLVADYALEGSEASDVPSEGVLCILGPGEEAAPAVLIFLTVCLEGNVRVPGSSAQSGCSSVGCSRRTSSP